MSKDIMSLTKGTLAISVGTGIASGVGATREASALGGMASYIGPMAHISALGGMTRMMKKVQPKSKKKRRRR